MCIRDRSCDAIGLCGPPPGNYCPKGMDKVRGPVRSDTYTLRTGDGPSWQSDPTSYVPGELLPLYLRVTRPTIMGKGYCFRTDKFGLVTDTQER